MLMAGCEFIVAEINVSHNFASGKGISLVGEVRWQGWDYGRPRDSACGCAWHPYSTGLFAYSGKHSFLFLQAHGYGLTFQQDNARSPTACLAANFLAQNYVNVLPYPADSPDMNPIEHIWDELGEEKGQITR
jgi:hypothetical protein